MKPLQAPIHLFVALAVGAPSLAQELVYTLGEGGVNGDDFGRAVGDAGDVDGDGFPDVIVGAPFDSAGSGRVSLYSGRTGELIWTRVGEYAGDAFGWSVDGIGDITGDGRIDLVVGAPLFDNGGSTHANGGRAYVVNGATAGNIMTVTLHEVNGQYGTAVRGLGDITGDGIGDFAFGAPYEDSLGPVDRGSVDVYSGTGTAHLFSRHGEEADAKYGFSVDVVRATGNPATSRLIVGEPGVDGASDIIIGANAAPYGEGRAYVHLARLDPPKRYCTAKVNSLGCTPSMQWQGVPSTSIADSFHVTAVDVINNRAGIMIWSHTAASISFMGGTLCVGAPIARTPIQYSGGNSGPTDCSGTFDFHFSHAHMASHGIVPGDRIHAQYWYRDPGSSFNVGLADAVRFDVVP